MQVKRQYIYVLLLISIVGLSSCVSKRNLASRYQTISQRAQATLIYDQHQYTMSSTIRAWRNELMIVSLQPMLGIELMRIEATPDSIWIFDKMNKRYTVMAYSEINQMINADLSYKKLQDFVDTPITPKKDAMINQRFTFNKHHLEITCKFSDCEYNTLSAPQRTKTDKYKHVTLREILPL
jgi:hypothetical protein